MESQIHVKQFKTKITTSQALFILISGSFVWQ